MKCGSFDVRKKGRLGALKCWAVTEFGVLYGVCIVRLNNVETKYAIQVFVSEDVAVLEAQFVPSPKLSNSLLTIVVTCYLLL